MHVYLCDTVIQYDLFVFSMLSRFKMAEHTKPLKQIPDNHGKIKCYINLKLCT